MSLRQNMLFISKEDNCGYSEALVQDFYFILFFFLYAILVELRNDNIRNELRSLLKNSLLSDEGILKNLMLAILMNRNIFKTSTKNG